MHRLTGGAARRAVMESVIAGLGGQTILVVSGVLVARALGVTDRGYLALLALIPTALAHLGALGLPLAVTFFISRAPQQARPILAAVLFPAAVQTFTAVALHGVIIYGLFAGQRIDVVIAGVATMVVLPLALVQQYGFAVLQGRRRFREFNALRLLAAAVYSAAVVTLMLVGEAHLLSIAGAWVGAYAIAAAITAVAVHRQLPPVQDASRPARRELFAFGLRSFAASASPIERFRLDQAVVGLALSPTALGLYVVASAFTSVIGFIGYNVGAVGYPYIAAERDAYAARRKLLRYSAAGLGASGAVFLILELAAPWIVPTFFGSEFSDAVPLTRILLIAALLLAARRLLGDLARGLGKPAYGTIAEIASWISLVTAFAVLIPTFGVSGAAWAVVVSSGVSLGAVLLLITRRGT